MIWWNERIRFSSNNLTVKTVLEVKGLAKHYKKVQAVKSLDLKVSKGMVFGILGPNGSGKTTTLGMLLGVIKPTAGTFAWFENGQKDVNRKRIGAMLETPNFYPYLNAERNLRIVAKIKEVDNAEERIAKVLKDVNLYERRKSKFRTFSLGMKQRLAIASALLNDPEVLLLDEPTNGLDPQGIAEIRNLIQGISKQGKTILIASHQLDEIEKICTDVVIIQNGDVIRQSSVDNVVGQTRQIVVSAGGKDLRGMVAQIDGVKVNREKDGLLLLDADTEVTTQSINKFFFDQGVVLGEIREIKKSLEDQFLEITKS